MSWDAAQTDREIMKRRHDEHVVPCMRGHRAFWWVYQRNGNASAFNGGHWTPSDYSGIRCEACGRRWRTKAAYVTNLPDQPPVTPEERLLLAIYGRNPDDIGEVRRLREHASCTKPDHGMCFPYPPQAVARQGGKQ